MNKILTFIKNTTYVRLCHQKVVDNLREGVGEQTNPLLSFKGDKENLKEQNKQNSTPPSPSENVKYIPWNQIFY